jgi:nicotinate-nucleotide pyrophosphorylase (carboxylating)
MIESFVREALAEEVGRGDLYALVEPAIPASAKIIAKSDGVVADVKYIDVLADIEQIEISWFKHF